MNLSRRTLRPAAAVVAAVLLLLVPGPAFGALTGGDPRQQREEVREKQRRLATELDVAQANATEVQQALDAIEASVAAEQAKLAEARRRATEAQAALERAQAAEARAIADVQAMQEAVNQLAVNAFIHPPSGGFYDSIKSEDLSEAVLKKTYIDVRANRDFDVLDQLAKAQDTLSRRRAEAETVATQAQDALAAVDERVDKLSAAERQQEGLLYDAEERLDAKLSESEALKSQDAALSNQIAADEAALARRLAASPAPSRPVSGPPSSSTVKLCTTHGITVACSIVDQLGAMLEAAQADGITMGGGGYRDPSQQIALRKAHCGTSYYDIYEKPPSQCSPPTARPGESMHERGLAVDFTYGGRVISSQDSPAFRWLSAHAASYGFYNLPSEPWHWSVNGQ